MIENKIQILERLFLQAISKKDQDQKEFILSQNLESSLENDLLELLKVSESENSFLTKLRDNILSDIDKDYPDVELKEGNKIGHYKIIRKIAKGGMATVYQALMEGVDFEQLVAIKVLRGHLLTSAGREQFSREQKTLAKLKHPGIAHIYDGGILEDKRPYLVMEMIKGVTIDQYFKKASLEEKIQSIRSLLRTLQFVHRNGIIHHDIKPGNVMIDEENNVKLLDLGISREIEIVKYQGQNIHSLFISPGFASPEQLEQGNITTASDIYQVGKLLESGISGNDFKNKTELVLIVAKACEQDPELRYSSANDMLEDIEAWGSKRPISSLSHRKSYRFRKWVQRNTITTVSIGLIFLALGIGAFSTFRQYQNTVKALAQANHQKQRASGFQNFMSELMLSSIPSENDGDTLSIFEVLKIGSEFILEDSLLTAPEMETAIQISNMYSEMASYKESERILGYLDSVYRQDSSEFERSHQDEIYQSLANVLDMLDRVPESDSILDLLLTEERLKTMSDTIRIGAMINRAKNLSYFHGKYKEADSILSELVAEDALNQYSDSEGVLAGILFIHAMNDYYLSDFKNAKKRMQKAITLYEKSPSKRQRTIVSYSFFLSHLYNTLGYTDTSLIIAQTAFTEAQKFYGSDHRMMGYYNSLIGICYADLYDYEPAIRHYKEAIRLDKKYAPSSVYNDYINLAYTYIDMDSTNLALNCLDSALPLAIDLLGKDHRFVGSIYSQYSMLYFINEDFKNALIYSDSTVKTFRKLNEPGNTDYLQSHARLIVSQHKLGLNKNWKSDFEQLLNRCRPEFTEEEIPFYFMIQLFYAEALADDNDYERCMAVMEEMIDFVQSEKNAKYGFYLQSVRLMKQILTKIGEVELAKEISEKRDHFLAQHS